MSDRENRWWWRGAPWPLTVVLAVSVFLATYFLTDRPAQKQAAAVASESRDRDAAQTAFGDLGLRLVAFRNVVRARERRGEGKRRDHKALAEAKRLQDQASDLMVENRWAEARLVIAEARRTLRKACPVTDEECAPAGELPKPGG